MLPLHSTHSTHVPASGKKDPAVKRYAHETHRKDCTISPFARGATAGLTGTTRAAFCGVGAAPVSAAGPTGDVASAVGTLPGCTLGGDWAALLASLGTLDGVLDPAAEVLATFGGLRRTVIETAAPTEGGAARGAAAEGTPATTGTPARSASALLDVAGGGGRPSSGGGAVGEAPSGGSDDGGLRAFAVWRAATGEVRGCGVCRGGQATGLAPWAAGA